MLSFQSCERRRGKEGGGRDGGRGRRNLGGMGRKIEEDEGWRGGEDGGGRGLSMRERKSGGGREWRR